MWSLLSNTPSEQLTWLSVDEYTVPGLTWADCGCYTGVGPGTHCQSVLVGQSEFLWSLITSGLAVLSEFWRVSGSNWSGHGTTRRVPTVCQLPGHVMPWSGLVEVLVSGAQPAANVAPSPTQLMCPGLGAHPGHTH